MYWKTPTLPHSSSLNYLNLSYYARGTKEELKKSYSFDGTVIVYYLWKGGGG